MLRFTIEKGIIVSVATCILMLFGLVAVFEVPIQMTPDVERRVIKVDTRWPGATPHEVESEIIIEQEQHLKRVQGLLRMTSNASMGSARINLEFSSTANVQDILLRVNNALSQVARYPENVDPPQLLSSSSSQEAFIFIGLEAEDPNRYQRAELTTLIETHVKSAMERIPGVAEFVIFGGAKQQVHIEVDTAELAARGITITQLRDAIRARNNDFSGGDIHSGKRRYLVRTVGRFETLDDIRATIIEGKDGKFISVADIATVKLASEEANFHTYLEGEPAIYMGIERSAGANVIEILESVKSEIANVNRNKLIPLGLSIRIYSDDVRYVSDAIAVVQKNLLLGAMLACVVLFLFFRQLTPTLLGTIGIPICTLGAFLGLLLMGRTLNVISLAGVAFAIGMTLDNSIVVMENIFRHRSMKKDRFTAALDGVSEVWPAVLASTLTTIFVFSPIILIQEEVGQLYSDIAIAISTAIIMSMLVAVAVLPSITARVPEINGSRLKQNNGMTFSLQTLAVYFQRAVNAVVTRLLQSRMLSTSYVLLTLFIAASLIYFLTPDAEYLPEGEENKLFFFSMAPAGYNAIEVNKVGATYDKLLYPALTKHQQTSESDQTSVPPIATYLRSANAKTAFAIIEPENTEDTEKVKALVTEEMRKHPGFIVFANRGSLFSGNTGGSRSIKLDISGDDLPTLYEVAREVYASSQTAMPGVQIRPIPSLSLGQPTLELVPNWERAEELGLSGPALGYTIWSMVDGAFLDEYFLDGKKIDIYLHSQKNTIEYPSDISNLSIFTPSGAVVPLNAVASLTHTVSSDSIRRVESERTVTLRIVPPKAIPLEKAVSIIQTDVVDIVNASGLLTGTTSIEIGGASDKLTRAMQALSNNILLAVALAYLLMVAIFSHWGFPLLILLNIPLGVSGGILGLWIINHIFGITAPFDMITMLGTIVLIGTVVNNPILLVEQTRRLLAEGLSPNDAILGGVNIRMRPIMMSMLTTIFGLSPVVFLAGAGTELYRGLGAIVLFGLLFSTFITLTFIPAALSMILRPSAERTTVRD